MMSKVPPTKLEGDNLDELITKAVSEPAYLSNYSQLFGVHLYFNCKTLFYGYIYS